MTHLLDMTPAPPDWTVDWEAINAAHPWLESLKGCPQNPIFHGEGDVWIHTKMVCEALAGMESFRALDPPPSTLLFAKAVLHDIGKPAVTREVNGRISARGHDCEGARIARPILWRSGVPFTIREHMCALIRDHLTPFFVLDRDDPQRRVLAISQRARCDLLTIHAEADARGRICDDQQDILDAVALFGELCAEQGCLEAPYSFSSDHTRFVYFQSRRRPPNVEVHDDTGAEVVLMSGLPGAGKSRWIDLQLPKCPQVSLDRIRRELKVSPTDNQGTVVQLARERAREHLRAGRPFVWNATSLTRRNRGTLIGLFARYGARVRIVYVEPPHDAWKARNRDREHVVPEPVLERMLARWEVPDRTEAHGVEYVIG